MAILEMSVIGALKLIVQQELMVNAHLVLMI